MAERLALTSALTTKIYDARMRQGLSQADLADKIGVKRATIKRIENRDVGTIDTKTHARIVKVLGLGGTRKPASRRSKKAAKRTGTIKSVSPSKRMQVLRQVIREAGLQDVTIGQLLGVQ